jgi:hypothetical protein
MTKQTKHANIGDIIRAEEFAFGKYGSKFNDEGHLVPILDEVTVDGKTKTQITLYTKPGTPWDKPREYISVNLGAYDSSRGKALFVVEEAKMDGGGSTGYPGDFYPDGWHVTARRLSDDRKYNPDGELISFYQSGCFNCMVEEVEVIGRMKKSFTEAD